MRMTERIFGLKAQALEFAPALVRVQDSPPSPLPRLVLQGLLVLCAVLLLWAAFGRLDIIAVAPGKLVPASYLQIVQPFESGIVKELLVKEGDAVKTGQVLVRMDTSLSDADTNALAHELRLKSLQLQRIEAELNGRPLKRQSDDPPGLFAEVEAQYLQRRQAYLDSIGEQQAVLRKAQEDLSNGQTVKATLERTLPVYVAQDEGWEKLADEGFAGKLMALERKRARMEKEGELRAQDFTLASLSATISQAQQRMAQITSNYRSQLLNERVEAEGQYQKLKQDVAKQDHREGLLALKAPQDGIIKDLSTHTLGTVVSPGTVLMTLVPMNESVLAEVWVNNVDAGFVQPKQKVKVKLTAYPFQDYGMLEGEVVRVSPDATELPDAHDKKAGNADEPAAPLSYRATVALKTAYLESDGVRNPLSPGMQVSAEIDLGTRTVLQYLLAPIKKVTHEAARER